jgi:hypothetical protein
MYHEAFAPIGELNRNDVSGVDTQSPQSCCHAQTLVVEPAERRLIWSNLAMHHDRGVGTAMRGAANPLWDVWLAAVHSAVRTGQHVGNVRPAPLATPFFDGRTNTRFPPDASVTPQNILLSVLFIDIAIQPLPIGRESWNEVGNAVARR